MSGIEADIRSALLTMDAVTALVGVGAAARIRADSFDQFDFRPNETRPGIVIEVDSEDVETDLSAKGGFAAASVNVLCRGISRAASRALAEAVCRNGTNPGTGLEGYSSDAFTAILEGSAAAEVPKSDGSTEYWYDVNLSFLVQHVLAA